MSAVSRILSVFAVVVGSAFSVTAYADVVKMSNSGLCHPPQSSWYERTKNYQPFGTLDACLDSGGRLPQGVSRTSVNGSRDESDDQRDYQRSAFGHGWDDADGDCQDSRAEALIATSSTTVRFAKDKGCRVVTGRWISPFTGNVIQNSSEIDIDHVVPLKWAWERGAKDWLQDKRERFANDRINLWPVELGFNRSKGPRPPSEWLPPSGQCGYVARFKRIVKVYGLEPTGQEGRWMQAFLAECER